MASKKRSVIPLVHGARRRVRMCAMWRLAATQAAKRADVKHDPLSVTRRSVAI